MKSIIERSKKLLIVIPDILTPDIVGAALGIANSLLPDKKVTIASNNQFPKDLSKLFDFTPYEIIHELARKEIVLTVNRGKGAVDDVRWRESDEKIQFIITPSEGDFEYSDVDIQTVGSDYDVVIVLGCKTLSSIGSMYESNRSFFGDSKIINIDVNQSNEQFGFENLIGEKTSLSSWVLDLLERDGFDLKKDGVDALFKGIFWANEGFRDDEDVKKAIGKFTQSGGQLAETVSQMFDTLTVAELRYIGSMVSNMKVTDDSVILSKITSNELQGVTVDRILYPEINILSRVKDYKVAILLTEYEPRKVLVRVYSNDKEKDVFLMFTEFIPSGNAKRITFEQEGDLDEVEGRVLQKVSGQKKLSTEPTSPTPVSSIEVEPPIASDKPSAVSTQPSANESSIGDISEETTAESLPTQPEDKQTSVEEPEEGKEEKKKDGEDKKPKKDPLSEATDFPEPEEAPNTGVPITSPGMSYAPPMGGGFGGPLGGTQAPSF